jgi:hypothetical protein
MRIIVKYDTVTVAAPVIKQCFFTAAFIIEKRPYIFYITLYGFLHQTVPQDRIWL